MREPYRQAFQPLLRGPRHPTYPVPVVRLGDRTIAGRTPARLEQGRLLSPAQPLAVALGLKVHRGAEGNLELRLGEGRVRLTPGVPMLAFSQESKGTQWRFRPLEVAPRAVGEAVLIPLRAVMEPLGAKVRWHSREWAAEITLPHPLPAPSPLDQQTAVRRALGRSRAWNHVLAARFHPLWPDPSTGGSRPVWEMVISPSPRAPVHDGLCRCPDRGTAAHPAPAVASHFDRKIRMAQPG